jgi:AAHS family 4-hydroxybenzoate transporter-like MFS transporter
MATEASRDLIHLIDSSKLGLFQLRAMLVCFVLIALDGFDTQSIAFVAPTLRAAWSVSPEMFGPLFGAGLFGTLIGSIFLGSLADKFGRKPMLLLSTGVFGLMTLCCATADSIQQLGTYRFLAGLGLGGAIPNILALTSEYSPKNVRSTAIVLTFAGFPIGAILGGMASARLIPHFGWESVFIAGGVLPLLMVLPVLLWVPESARFLAIHQGLQVRLQKIIKAIAPELDEPAMRNVRLPVPHKEHIPVQQLFSDGRAIWTILLWSLTFTTLLLAYFLVNWIPLLLADTGMEHKEAIMGVVVLNLGGILGGFVIGRISDRKGPFKALAIAFFIGAVFVATVGLKIDSPVPTLLTLIFFAGCGVFGAQLNLSAITATYYPIAIRGTGIGWGMGLGRFGSVVGPTIGGALIAFGLSRGDMFLVAAIPAIVSGLLVVVMSFHAPAPEGKASGHSGH